MSMENPFLSPTASEPPPAALPLPAWGPPPRIWTAIVVPIVGMVTAFVVTLIVALIAMSIELGGQVNVASATRWSKDVISRPIGLIMSVVPMQLVLLGVACAAAALSKEPFAGRLALKRGRMPIWSWPFLALGTPIFGLISSLVISAVFEDLGENMKLMEEMFRSLSDSFFPGLVLLVGIVPGIAEEVMFRGYCQSRLLKRWPPALAIGVSAVLFSCAHLDPIHVLGVLPLGIWLGVIAWRSGSVWPAILGHAANNTLAVMAVKSEVAATLAILGLGVPALALAIVLMCLRFSGPGDADSPGGGPPQLPLAGTYPPPEWPAGLPPPQMPWLQAPYPSPSPPPPAPPADFGTPGRGDA
jgi:membrane protease YdiL (CAAX protease family)